MCECPDTENVYDDDQGKSLLKFINKSLRYPVIAQEAGVSGNVFVTYYNRENEMCKDEKRNVHELMMWGASFV